MSSSFSPDYRHLVDAARNIEAARIPLYTHGIDPVKMEELTSVRFVHLAGGSLEERRRYHRHFNEFHRFMGYDSVSFERGVCGVVQNGAGLIGTAGPLIASRREFETYPFERAVEDYFSLWDEDFSLMYEQLPEGMLAVGGIGNGIFEVVQDLTTYPGLCYLKADDPELYADLFTAVGELEYRIWKRFLGSYGEAFCVCRFGDDLGYKASTLLSPDDIRRHIIPQYKRIVDLVHASGKPFLLHSCGNIFSVMDDLIDTAGIDAKHSNEDQIAPFSQWVERYGDRIGNFGGVDMDYICQHSPQEIRRYTLDVIEQAVGHGGFALGTGNSIPRYVPADGYLAMVNALRVYRGDGPVVLEGFTA